MRKTIIEYVKEYAETFPDKIAVIDHGRETTYLELFHLVLGYRRYLIKQGVKKSDVIVLKAGQNLEYVILYLSIHCAGAVVASLEKNTSNEMIIKVAGELQARYILSEEVCEDSDADFKFIQKGDVVAIAKEYSEEVDPERIVYPELDDSADILFTTGTTGASKGVELSHKALVATAENLIYGCGYKPDTVIIVPGPLNHANAIRKLFTTLVNGSTIYLLDGMLNIKNFYNALDYEKGTIACCLPPSAIRTLFQLTGDKLGEYSERIDFIESATSPLPEPDKIRLCRLLPTTRLYNNYGSSESASVCMYDYNANPGKVGCIGKAMPNSEVLIVDDEKNVIVSSAGHTGLIACKGDVNMKGYVNAPELTREVLQNGIVYTNDMGYIDDEGFVYIVGRQGDVINVGGLKVAPTEVEEAALAYDGVDDCICLGIDDEITGKALKLLVVMHDGIELDPRKLRLFLSSKLDAHKVPKFFEVVDHIKKTYNGKLDRKAYMKKL